MALHLCQFPVGSWTLIIDVDNMILNLTSELWTLVAPDNNTELGVLPSVDASAQFDSIDTLLGGVSS